MKERHPGLARVAVRGHPLGPLFAPRSVALVGASERPGSVGTAVLANLRDWGFEGAIHLVNPCYRELSGRRCHASLGELPEPVDIAIVASPAATVPRIVEQAARAGIRHLVVLSGGFAESGESSRSARLRTGIGDVLDG